MLGFVVEAPAHAAEEEAAKRGEYVFNAAGCAGCHTDVLTKGPLLAGGRLLETRFGSFYSPNITPDPTDGVGTWSQADFITALRRGTAPDGTPYFPSFPFSSFTGMSEADISDLWTYISTRPAISRADQPHKLRFPFNLRILMWGWRLLFFEEGQIEPVATQSEEWNRGNYLVRALSHCGECHTPRKFFGGVDGRRELGGNPVGPNGKPVPNITPDSETGIGGWSDEGVVDYLSIGMTPEGDFAGGSMAEVVDQTTSKLTAADRRAIAIYIKSLPAIRNSPKK